MTERSLKDILAFHGDLFARVVDCDRVLAVLSGPHEATYRKGFEDSEKVNDEIWDNVVRRGEAVRIEQAEAQLRNPGPKMRSALAVPLLNLADQPIGLLYAESHHRFSAFNERHLAAARGRALLLSNELAEGGYTQEAVDSMATVSINKESFWMRMIQQGLQKEESEAYEAAEEQLKAALNLAKDWGPDDARVIKTHKAPGPSSSSSGEAQRSHRADQRVLDPLSGAERYSAPRPGHRPRYSRGHHGTPGGSEKR